jgi:hypothetical protein
MRTKSSRTASQNNFQASESFAFLLVFVNRLCGCVACEGRRAANALHFARSSFLELASRDADLRRMISAWAGLPEAIRRATWAMIDSGSGRQAGAR